MAYAKWKKDSRDGRTKTLVARWRDPSVPGGWREERRPNDRTKGQAEDYAREREKQADRIVKGLELAPVRVEFGDVWDQWWTREGRRRRGSSTEDYRAFLEKHLSPLRPFLLTPATGGAFAEKLDVLLDGKEDRRELAPQSLNHLRAGVFRMFECARDPKHRLWPGENPVRWVKRRKVPKRKYETLRREQVRPLLAALPAPTLASPWRWAAAIILYAGTRPGEVFGLHREDIDLEEGILTVRRSWSQPVPKDDEPRRLVIVSELRPFLEEALRASQGALVFPRPDGKAYDPTTRFRLVDHLRRALCAIGDVLGYDHTCRRCKAKATRGGPEAPKEFTWRHPDGHQRQCPTCRMKLWATPIPRPVRFYDLRHTHATLLRKARVDLGTVQKALGHSSPEITAGTYDHSELEDERETLERVLTFEPPKPRPPKRAHGAHMGRELGTRKSKPPSPPVSRGTTGASVVGATGFEPATTCTPSKCATRLRYAPFAAGKRVGSTAESQGQPGSRGTPPGAPGDPLDGP